MPELQFKFDFAPRTKIKLSVAMNALKRSQVFDPVPCREWIIDQILEGKMDGKLIGGIWWIYLDSFESWVRSLDEPEQFRRAA